MKGSLEAPLKSVREPRPLYSNHEPSRDTASLTDLVRPAFRSLDALSKQPGVSGSRFRLS